MMLSYYGAFFRGKSLDLKIGPNGELESLRYYRNNLQTLLVEKRDGQYFADNIHLDTETITAFRVAEIEEDSPNLFLAGKKAGIVRQYFDETELYLPMGHQLCP